MANLLGKRYSCGECEATVLVTKPGDSIRSRSAPASFNVVESRCSSQSSTTSKYDAEVTLRRRSSSRRCST